MNNLQKLSITLLSGVIAAICAMPANAFQVTLGGTLVPGKGVFSDVPGATTIDFESGAPISGPVVYSSPYVVSGSQFALYGTPNNDLTKYLTVGSFSKSVTITFDQLIDYFGLYLGSPDSYNSIALYKDSTLLKLFPGSNFVGNSSVYLNFFANSDEYFNKVSIFSQSPAAETDNHAYRFATLETPPAQSVPEPSSMLGLLAFGTFGIASRLKRKQQQKVLNSVVND
jgi:PEP-CTERM putative exosortase interaction domain